MKGVHKASTWVMFRSLSGRLNNTINESLVGIVESIADRNDKILGVKVGLFYYRGKRYPEHRISSFMTQIPSLHEELHAAMDAFLVTLAREKQEEQLSNSFLMAICQSTTDKVELTARIPTVLHPTLHKIIGEVGGPLPDVSMEQLGIELKVHPDCVEAFKLRVMRLLLE